MKMPSRLPSGVGSHALWTRRTGRLFREDVVSTGNLELIDQRAELSRHLRQIVGSFLRFLRAVRGSLCGFCNACDIAGNLARSLGRISYIACHFVSGSTLSLNRRGNSSGNLVHLIYHGRDRADCFHRAVGISLNGGDLMTDVFSGLGSLTGEFFDFVGDNCKALAGFTRPCSLNGGVQGKEFGLLGDRGDDLDNLTSFSAGFTKFTNGGVGGPRRLRSAACDGCCLVRV